MPQEPQIVSISKLVPVEMFATALETWERQRCGSVAPPWSLDMLLQFPNWMLRQVTVADVRQSPEDYVYRYWGSAHTTLFGIDLTGKSVSDLTPSEWADWQRRGYRDVVRQACPIGFRHDRFPGAAPGTANRDTLGLPLSNDGTEITNVLCVTDCISDPDEHQVKLGGARATAPRRLETT